MFGQGCCFTVYPQTLGADSRVTLTHGTQTLGANDTAAIPGAARVAVCVLTV